jgi:hypothetical protein
MNTLIPIDFITSTGTHKILEKRFTPNNEYVQEIREFLADIQCSICFDIYEIPLITRACEHTLCAYCYLKLDNKVCPSCNTRLPNTPEDGLYKAPRILIKFLDNIIINSVVKSDKKKISHYIDKSSMQSRCIQQILKKDTSANTNSSDLNYVDSNSDITNTATYSIDEEAASLNLLRESYS